MNRVIKFRGKRIIGDKWVYGYLESRPQSGATFIHQYYPNGVYHTQDRVEPESVGQFTGLQDANGVDIYEGDLLVSHENGEVFEVVYDAPEFCFKDNVFGFKFLNHPENFEVCGNIFDNKDFMERQYHRPKINNVAELLKDTSYYANKYPDTHATYADDSGRLGFCDITKKKSEFEFGESRRVYRIDSTWYETKEEFEKALKRFGFVGEPIKGGKLL